MSQREVDDYERNVLGLVRSSDINKSNLNNTKDNTRNNNNSGIGVGYDNATGNVSTKVNDNP